MFAVVGLLDATMSSRASKSETCDVQLADPGAALGISEGLNCDFHTCRRLEHVRTICMSGLCRARKIRRARELNLSSLGQRGT